MVLVVGWNSLNVVTVLVRSWKKLIVDSIHHIVLMDCQVSDIVMILFIERFHQLENMK